MVLFCSATEGFLQKVDPLQVTAQNVSSRKLSHCTYVGYPIVGYPRGEYPMGGSRIVVTSCSKHDLLDLLLTTALLKST